MKSKQSFRRSSEDSLIVITCQLDRDPLGLAIDTGASHTTIDITSMLIAGYKISHATGKVQLEAASGIIDAYVFVVKEFHSLGVTRKDFEICSYDFFAYHYLTDFDGVLGLDFFEGIKFCIDMQKSEITISLEQKFKTNIVHYHNLGFTGLMGS